MQIEESASQKSTRPKHFTLRWIGYPIAHLRDLIAKGLVVIHVTPNMLTVFGLAFSLAAGLVLARGAEQSWIDGRIPASFWAGLLLVLACAMDMLDGAVARIGHLHSRFGGVLDSTVDRVSDFAIFGGIALAYARIGNLTFALLALLAVMNAYLISYVKARAECESVSCSVGFWQRGERMFGILVACFTGHASTLVLMLGLLASFSVVKRLIAAHAGLNLQTDAAFQPKTPRGNALVRFFWQHDRRGTWPHTFFSFFYSSILAFVRMPAHDILRPWLDVSA